MAASSRSRPGARIAVIGAGSPDGARVRAALAQRGYPGERVDLFGATHGEMVLSEYDGEARLIQEPDAEDVASRAAVVFCERGAMADRLRSACRGRAYLVDLTGDPASGPLLGSDDDRPEHSAGGVAVPHFLSYLLGSFVAPLHRGPGVRRAVLTVLRPASDFGEEGLDELREQVVRLLRFEKAPMEVFGRQLAFNLLPQALLPGAESTLEERVRAEVRALAGTPPPRLNLSVVAVPIFFGHAISGTVELERGGSREMATALSEAEGVSLPADDAPSTPMDWVQTTRGIGFRHLDDDGQGAVRFWAVAGEAAGAAAERAVDRLAERIAP